MSSDITEAIADPKIAFVPVLGRFEEAADSNLYVPIPDGWWVGVSDVVDSTGAIDSGRYKAVNLAGAGTISGVSNALGGQLELFVFAGDGARFAVPAHQVTAAAEALSRVAMWARRDLKLDLRIGMSPVADIRAAGLEVLTVFWQASKDVRYVNFAGGGVEWVEKQVKAGVISLPEAPPDDEPDLTGLSCQWGSILSRNGNIVSLIVKRAKGAPESAFARCAAKVVSLLEATGSLNPVPIDGPAVRWPAHAFATQSLVARKNASIWLRRLLVIPSAAFAWLIFKLRLRIGGFEPDRYRQEMAANTDFRKFDDGLLMTVDCSSDTIAELRTILEDARASGAVRFGLHTQNEALITCVVPSFWSPSHMHFVDGANGGYASASRLMS